MPDIRYVMTDDDVRIAYQVFGEGPATVLSLELLSHLELPWRIDRVRAVCERLAANLQIYMFDHRGTGLSDGFNELPSLDDRTLDIKAVLDAEGLDKAHLMGWTAGAQVAVGFAAAFPGRTQRLVLTNARVGRSARPRAEALNPGGTVSPAAWSEHDLSPLDKAGVEVDEGWIIHNPSLAKHPDLPERLVKLSRLIGNRHTAAQQVRSTADVDIVEVAPLVNAPTLILHAIGNRLHHVGYARLLAELMPNATLVELEGEDQWFWIADNWKDYVDGAVGFITDTPVEAPLERRFAVVVFTDIVGSTSALLESGDGTWRDRLDVHDRISRHTVTDHGGSLVNTTGDGIVATFTTPSQAVAATVALRVALLEAGLSIRAGIHAGEIEVRGNDISGAIVHLAARVEQVAADGDIYVTEAIRDMLIGSEHHFDDAGEHHLKGFDGVWSLYRVSS